MQWIHGFALGRLAGLAATFCAVPFILALPALAREAAPILIATVGMCALGLVGLRTLRHAWQVSLASILGLVALAGGYWAGLAPATVAIALLTLALEVMAVPGKRSPTLIGAAGALALGLVALLLLGPAVAVSSQALLSAALLPLPAIVTTAFQLSAMQREAEKHAQQVARAALRGEAMLTASEASVVIVERGGHVVDATDAACALLAVPPTALAGRGLVERVLIADRPAFLKAASDAAMASVACTITLRMSLAGPSGGSFGPGDFVPVSLEFRAVPGDNEHASVRLTPVVTARTRPSLAARDTLFATLSHEVRTPMNAILGFAEMLANPSLCPTDKEKVAEYAAIIHRSARDSFAVTRAVIDLLRVENESFRSARDVIDLDEMLRACIAQVISRENEQAVTASIRGAGQIDTINADPKAVRMLLNTLVEGFSAAVGFPATLDCNFSMFGMKPVLEIAIAHSAAGGQPPERSAFVGVIRVLAARLAEEVGAELTLSQRGAGWHAYLIFNSSAPVVSFPAHGGTTAKILPLRKSA